MHSTSSCTHEEYPYIDVEVTRASDYHLSLEREPVLQLEVSASDVDKPSKPNVLRVGWAVPLVQTVKNILQSTDGSGNAVIRIQFNVPGAAFGAAGYFPAIKHPDATFVQEVSYRSMDARHATHVCQELKTLRRTVRSHHLLRFCTVVTIRETCESLSLAKMRRSHPSSILVSINCKRPQTKQFRVDCNMPTICPAELQHTHCSAKCSFCTSAGQTVRVSRLSRGGLQGCPLVGAWTRAAPRT